MSDATVKAVQEGHTRYTAVTGKDLSTSLYPNTSLYPYPNSPISRLTGEAELRKAICKDLERRKGVRYAPEEIIVGNGAKQEVYQAVLALCR